MGNNPPRQERWHPAEFEHKVKELPIRFPKVDQHLREELLKTCLENIEKNVKPPKEYVWEPNIEYNYETRDYPDVQLDAYKYNLWKLRDRMYDPSKPST